MPSTPTHPTPTPSSHGETIPIISIGIHRLPAANTFFTTNNLPYRIVAFLDFTDTAPAYQYSAHNLAVLLHNLHPRPKALLTGTAVMHESGREGLDVVGEVRGVWEGYVRDVLEKEREREGGDEGVEWWEEREKWDGKAVYVPLSDFRSQAGPPPPGMMEYAVRKLDEVFRPEVEHQQIG